MEKLCDIGELVMKKIKKSRFLLLMGIVVCASFLVGCSNVLDDKLISIDIEYLSELLESSESNFVYIASPTCPACQEFKPIVQEFLNDNERYLYYFNTDEAFSESPDELVELMEALNVTMVPIILYFEGEEVRAIFEENLTLEDLQNFFESLGY